MKRVACITFVIIVFFIHGCATIGSINPGSGSTFTVKEKSYEEIWESAVRTMTNDLSLAKSNKDTGIIKSKASVGVASWGAVVGLFIKPPKKNQDEYIVEVVSKKRMQTQITGPNWEKRIITNMKAELSI